MTTSIETLKGGAKTQDNIQRNLLDLLRNPKVVEGMKAVATQHLTAEKMLRLCNNAVSRTPKLALCNPQSVLGAMMTSQALGLEPNTVLQQAFIIPYKSSHPQKDARGNIVKGPGGKWLWEESYDAQFQIGYRGFVTLFHRCPSILSVEAEAIHRNDLFEHMMGSNAFLRFQKTLFDRGELIGAYCFTHQEAGEQATVLPLEEIIKIRGRSETYKKLVSNVEKAQDQNSREKAEKKLNETPWVLWEDDMAAKSAIKKHAKKVSLGDSMVAAAAEVDSQADIGNADMSAMADVDVARSVVIEGEPIPEQEAPVSSESYAPSHQPTKQEWPRKFSDPETGEVGWSDSSGEVFDADKHGMGRDGKTPSVTATGRFRARRGTRRQEAAHETAAPAAQDTQGASAESAPAVTADELADRAQDAQDAQALDEIEGLVQTMDSPAEQNAIRVIVQLRRRELEQ